MSRKARLPKQRSTKLKLDSNSAGLDDETTRLRAIALNLLAQPEHLIETLARCGADGRNVIRPPTARTVAADEKVEVPRLIVDMLHALLIGLPRLDLKVDRPNRDPEHDIVRWWVEEAGMEKQKAARWRARASTPTPRPTRIDYPDDEKYQEAVAEFELAVDRRFSTLHRATRPRPSRKRKPDR